MWKPDSCPLVNVQMSKAEKAQQKKEKAKQFNNGGKKAAGKVAKNSKRWN